MAIGAPSTSRSRATYTISAAGEEAQPAPDPGTGRDGGELQQPARPGPGGLRRRHWSARRRRVPG
ncbi:hypothetical protein ACRAWF_26185 [Streptomyces sp. L7]